jgi:hypothetical protein
MDGGLKAIKSIVALGRHWPNCVPASQADFLGSTPESLQLSRLKMVVLYEFRTVMVMVGKISRTNRTLSGETDGIRAALAIIR